ncbi:MAG: CcmD family protein [Fimbriimonadales bacterium]|nr:CcmD family protein [Fimbriimonadales bacterium]
MWCGLFAYLWIVERRLRQAEKELKELEQRLGPP